MKMKAPNYNIEEHSEVCVTPQCMLLSHIVCYGSERVVSCEQAF